MKIKFVPKDMWIGLYVETICLGESGKQYEMEYTRMVTRPTWRHFARTFYLCLIPCVPIIWKTQFSKRINP